MSLEVTAFLKDALGELYYKEGSDQHGWASIPLKDINIKDNILAFNKGANKINIKLMEKIVPEIKEIARPVNGKFVFDYLSCKVGNQKKFDSVMLANPEALCWVKIGGGMFSSDQIDALGRMKLPLAIFRIRDLLAPPAKIEMKWEIKT